MSLHEIKSVICAHVFDFFFKDGHNTSSWKTKERVHANRNDLGTKKFLQFRT